MLRAGVYVRISQDRTGARGGVERQRQDCVELCERRGWEVAAVYEDNDTSAFGGRERPAYGRLMGDVADGVVEVVVAWHTDRLWRSVVDQQLALAEWSKAGLAMVATCSGGDVDPSSADDGFVATIHAAVAQHESATKARRARRKAEQLVADGRHTGGGCRPFGHTADRRGLVEDEARLVVEACRRVVAGEPSGSVAADWRARGVMTAQGRTWTHPNLVKLLRQPRLAGLSVHRGRVVGEASWPPVVDRALWERTQSALDARLPTRRQAPTRSLLGGLLACGRCGAAMVAGSAYRCPSRSQGGCGGVSIGRAWTEGVVTETVAAYVASDRYAEAVTARAADSSELDQALEAVAEAERRLATLDAMFSAGETIGGDFRTMRSRLVEVLAEAREAVSVSSGESVVAPGALSWEGLNVGQRRAIMVTVLERVTVLAVGRGRRRAPDDLVFDWRA